DLGIAEEIEAALAVVAEVEFAGNGVFGGARCEFGAVGRFWPTIGAADAEGRCVVHWLQRYASLLGVGRDVLWVDGTRGCGGISAVTKVAVLQMVDNTVSSDK